MKESKSLSVVEQINLYYLYSGVIWIICGLVGFFDGILFDIIECITITALIITHVFVMRAKKENQDELSIKNYHKARSHASPICILFIWLLLLSCNL